MRNAVHDDENDSIDLKIKVTSMGKSQNQPHLNRNKPDKPPELAASLALEPPEKSAPQADWLQDTVAHQANHLFERHHPELEQPTT